VSQAAGASRPHWLSRLKPDRFVLTLICAVLAASLLPVRGEAAHDLGLFTRFAVGLLFFLHGARLPREAVLRGLTHWRLHLVVASATFVLFPLLGLAAAWATQDLLARPLRDGLIFLGCLPSTIQSSIAFTSVARGDVAAAVTSASMSNLIGMVLTPLLVGALLATQGGGLSLSAAEGIFLQLLAPFIAGQVLRTWIGGWIGRHARFLTLWDRGTIALIVYGAFSEAVVNGVWRTVSALQILALVGIAAVLLAIVIACTTQAARRLGFSKEDEIAIVFCGSKKTITGVPMAGILFPAGAVGALVLPLMIFHQLQLMVCAILAQRYAARPTVDGTTVKAST
jgi:sodium/bile acid cotransporter 7